jgi:hypothetical protein
MLPASWEMRGRPLTRRRMEFAAFAAGILRSIRSTPAALTRIPVEQRLQVMAHVFFQ